MAYVQTEYWKALIKDLPDDVLEVWITSAERILPGLKEIASHSDVDSPIHKTVEMQESDISLYKEEKKRRLAH